MPLNRPNILCFVTDQQRADHLSCMGHPVLRTPNIDRIAQTGVRFTRAYVNNPLCMPSRATLFTGWTPRAHRVRTNGIPLDPTIPTITGALTEAGYRTHSVGKIHLNPFGTPRGEDTAQLDPKDFPEASAMWRNGRITKLPEPYYGLQTTQFVGGHGQGFFGEYLNDLQKNHPDAVPLLCRDHARVPPTGADQSWKSALPEELHATKWVADRTIEFLTKQGRSKDQPFFLWCSFPDPHHPYCPPAPWDSLYDPADVPLPIRRKGELDKLAPFFRQVYEKGLPLSGRFAPTKMPDEHLREILAHTFGMIALIDHHVGRVLGALEAMDLRENTVIVYLSDHRDMMGDHYLINKGPFHFDGLLRIPFIWSWPGHFPQDVETDGLVSLLDFAPTILSLCGVPIPEGRTPAEPECPQMPPPWPGRSLVPQLRGDVRFVRDRVLVENDEDYLGLRLRTLITDRYKLTVYPGQPYGELFDRANDPDELEDRWDDPAYKSIQADLKAQLLEELTITDNALPRRLCHA